MNYIKQKLKSEYGIYIKRVHIHGTLGYWGDTYYLPYVIRGTIAGSIVIPYDGKVYPNMKSILEEVENKNE